MTVLERALELTEKLVAFDTESSKSNLALIEFVESYLRAEGVPYVSALNDAGDKASIFAAIGPNVAGGVVLSGHTDVVPVAGQAWTGDPFALRREGSRLVGRGAVDMKGFCAVCLAMVSEFKAAALTRPVHLLLSHDEETTCKGSLTLIERLGRDLPLPSVVIVGEPTSMQVADAHKSVTTYVTKVTGREAHSANPRLGASAVHGAILLAAELLRIGDEFESAKDPTSRFDPPFSTIHVGTLHGGTARNILAKECALHWEIRGMPGACASGVHDKLAQFAKELEARMFAPFPGAGIETRIEVEVPALTAEPGSAAERLALRLARRNHTIAVPYASEAGQFQKAGVATVICGPGSIDQAHQPDEFIEIGEIEACIGFMRGLAGELSA